MKCKLLTEAGDAIKPSMPPFEVKDNELYSGSSGGVHLLCGGFVDIVSYGQQTALKCRKCGLRLSTKRLNTYGDMRKYLIQ